MNSMIKDIGTFLFASTAVVLNIIAQMNEILVFLSLLLGVVLLIMRLYSRHLDIFIKKKKIKELDKNKHGSNTK